MNNFLEKNKALCKRILAAIIVLCLLVCLAPIVNAEDTQQCYVVLGDSISTGYGLKENEKPFCQQVTETNSFKSTMFAQDGETTGTLLDKLSDTATAETLASADVITITIGGNDLMNSLYAYFSNKYNEKYPDSPKTPEEIKEDLINKNITTIFFFINEISGFAESNEAQSGLADFSVQLNKILFKLKELNPEALIIIAKQYNPYNYIANETKDSFYGTYMTSIANAFDNGVTALNTVIETTAEQYSCSTADVYSAFNNAEENPCNASVSDSMNSVELDYHPNAYGHQIIADVINDILAFRAKVTPDGKVFGEQTEGYEASDTAPQEFTIENTGRNALDNLSVNLIGTDKDSFVLNTSDTAASVAAGSSTKFSITPKTGLKAGEYSAAVEIHADNISVITKQIVFKVNEPLVILGIEDGKTYCGPVEVSFVGDNLESVKINGEEIIIGENKFVIDAAEGSQTVVFTDRSGKEFSYNITVNSGHTTHIINKKHATCIEEGYTGDTVCKICGITIEKGSVIEKTDHYYDNGVCIVCGKPEEKYSIGDVNMDGIIDVSDVTAIQLYLSKSLTSEEFNSELADMNGDKTITVLDATLIQIMISENT